MDVRTETGYLSKDDHHVRCRANKFSLIKKQDRGEKIIHNRPLFTKSVFVCRRKKCVTAKIHSSLHQGEWLAFGLPFYFASFWWIWPSGAGPILYERNSAKWIGRLGWWRGANHESFTLNAHARSLKHFPPGHLVWTQNLSFYRVYVCVEGRRCLLRSHSTGNMLIYTATCASASSHFRATSCTRPSSCPAKCKLMILRSQAWK